MIQIIVLWLFLISQSIAQNCQQAGCAPGFCCSKWGFCGDTALHCQGGQTDENQNGNICNPPCQAGFCCSKWGFCGDTALHCQGGQTDENQNGNICNPPCQPGFCCSKWGFCGNTALHCDNTVSTAIPSTSTTTNPIPSASTTTNPIPSASTTTNPIPSASTTTNPIPSASTTTNPIPSVSTTSAATSTFSISLIPLNYTTTYQPGGTTITRPLIGPPSTRAPRGRRSNREITMIRQRFDCIFDQISSSLRDKRWQGYQEALLLISFEPKNEDELMMFFAHVYHETDGLITYEEYCGKSGACADNYQGSWCSPDVQAQSGKHYYGRGWLRLSWPCNYNAAGRALGVDFLGNPEKVAESDTFAAATAMWFWNANNMSQPARDGNFGETTKKINSIECGATPQQTNRIERYQKARQCFGLSRATANLRC